MRSPRHRTKVVLLVAVAVLAGGGLTGCRSSADSAADDQHAVTLDPVSGTDRFTVTLSADAARRLDITTRQVQAAGATALHPGARQTVPYAAVVYDADGSTWAYAEVAPRSYTRQPITVQAIVGTTAYLSAGPAAGTPVVVVGAPELLGAEYQIAGEE